MNAKTFCYAEKENHFCRGIICDDCKYFHINYEKEKIDYLANDSKICNEDANSAAYNA